jgi:hypothetical protein
MKDQHELDEILGIMRCDRCGRRLENEIECPYCSDVEEPVRKNIRYKWVYFTACFLTSPLSIYFIVKDSRLNLFEKVFAASGAIAWFGVFLLRF